VQGEGVLGVRRAVPSDETQYWGVFTDLVADVCEKCNSSCTLYSGSYLTLMLCASTCDSSGKNLGTLTYKLSKACGILVIDMIYLLCAELANFLSLAIVLAEGFLFSIHFTILLYYF
jgi:hypothetical protein